jgi:hypothetical protein
MYGVSRNSSIRSKCEFCVRSQDLFDKFIGDNLVRSFNVFIKLEDCLSCSHYPMIQPYLEPVTFCSHDYIFSSQVILILSCHLH